MPPPTTSINNQSTCSDCSKSFRTERGLNIHKGKVHNTRRNCHSIVAHVSSVSDTFLKDNVSKDIGNNQNELHFNLAFLKRNTLIIKRIPKSARPCIAEALSKKIDACTNFNNKETWESLLNFVYNSLSIPQLDKNGQKTSLTSIIKKNISGINSPHIIQKNSSSIKHKLVKNRFINSVINKVSEGDISSAVKILISSDTFAEFDHSTLAELRTKHPISTNHDNFPIFPGFPKCLEISEDDVLQTVRSFRTGSAGGIDSLRPSHVQDLLSYSSGVSSQKLLVSLTRLCNLLLSGNVLIDICPLLYGASLCALKKKDGGIRPIAVGTFYRRLVAKIACRKMLSKLGSIFRPIQFGVGTPGGCETVTHSARRFINQHTSFSEKVFLKLDFKNAFNMIHRDVMLQEVMSHIPEVFPFVEQCYKNPSFLLFGQDIIMSERGVQQGDPLGPALFCLSIQNLVKKITTEYNCWYLDDGSIGGDADSVLTSLQDVILESKQIGLELNINKCEIFVSGHVPGLLDKILSVAPGIKLVDSSKWSLLGAPLSDYAIPICLEEKLQSLILMSSRIIDLPAHIAFFLLRNCLAIPKLMHILRCSPTWKFEKDLQRIDNYLHSILEQITNNQLDDSNWTQATLPISRGGLGIRLTSSLSLPAFLSSVCSVSHLVDNVLNVNLYNSDYEFVEAEELWCSKTSSTLTGISRSIQKAWDQPLLDLVSDKLFETAICPIKKARLLALRSKYSGAWLNALPVASLGTLLDDDSFRVSVGLRLGTRICAEHTCKCGYLVREFDSHGLSCKFSAGRLSRHHAVNDLIKRALGLAQVPSILEPLGISRCDGKRPDGMTLIPWEFGKSIIWDFTCVDTLAPSHISSSSLSAGSAALSAEKLKSQKYNNLLSNYIFCPVAIETLGVFGPKAIEFINNIGKKISIVTHDPRATTFLTQRISIAIQRGNAASLFGTFPPSAKLDEFLLFPNFRSNKSYKRSSINISNPAPVSNLLFQNIENSNLNGALSDCHISPSDISSHLFSNTIKSPDHLYSPKVTNCQFISLTPSCFSLEGETSEIQILRELPLDTFTSKKVGLDNLGNTCYMNSVLQALFMTKAFRNEVMLKNLNCQLYSELQKLFLLLQFSKRNSLCPNDILRLSMPPGLIEGNQFDSSEFLEFFLDELHVQQIILINSTKESSENEGHKHDSSEFLGYQQNTLHELEKKVTNSDEGSNKFEGSTTVLPTIVQHSFGGRTMTVSRCGECSSSSERADHFRELQLSFPNHSDNQSVQTLLDYFLQPEKLNGDNQYHCVICSRLTDGDKVTKIVEAPSILIITLKQFKYDHTSHQFTKLLQTVTLDDYLTIDKYRYQLYAAIIHCGSSAISGHFYTFAKDKTQWYKFNDSFVSNATTEDLRRLKPPDTAYVLFYRREDISEPDNLPPTILPSRLQTILTKDQSEFDAEKYQQSDKLLNFSLNRNDEPSIPSCAGDGFSSASDNILLC